MERLTNALFIAIFVLLSTLSAACAEAPNSFRINEICSDNGGHYTIEDSTPDYVELYNLTDQSLSLDGFFISDDEDHLDRFSLDGYVIPENGYITLTADKKELPFKLSASDGEDLFLSDGERNIMQHVILPPLEQETTYSLQENGEWQIAEPTPLAENVEGTPYVKKVYVASPRFSHPAGFYDTPFDLSIDSYSTYKVYYTTDGSVPDEHSTPYTGPIRIEDATSQPNSLSARTDITVSDAVPPSGPIKKATIIRAVAIDPDGNQSNNVVNTYFVGFQNYDSYQNIPILSIVTDPHDLFDEQDGIYVRGKVYKEWLSDEKRNQDLTPRRIPTNYKMRGREWEIPVSIQWFSADHSLQLSQGAGLRIHGDWSRENAQKAFNLYARKEYGTSTFAYDILAGLPGKEKLVVRTNLARDSLFHALLQETGLPISSCTPCLTFINGEFWGLYEIRDKQAVKDIANFFGLNKQDLLVVKNQELVAGTTPDEVQDKSSKGIHKFLISEFSRLDASVPQEYEALNELIDVDNYITHAAGIAFLNNTDSSYRHNYTIWRTAEKGSGEYEDGRWRWVFQDLDMCCYNYDGVKQMILSLPEDVLFSSLWKNSEFQTKFLTRIMDFANVELTPEYVRDFITPILTYYDPYLYETNVRFSSKDTSTKPGTKSISSLVSFFQTRRNAVINQLTETFQLTRGTSTLLLNGLPDGIALEINGHKAHLYKDSWIGIYFKGCTVSFSVGDIPGCRFIGWYEGSKLITAEQTVEISTDNDRTITPVYEDLPVIVLMNENEMIYGTGKNGFTKQLTDSMEECVIMPDDSVKAERKYFDSSIQFHLNTSVDTPQGFTLTVPLHKYIDVGGYFTLSVPDSYSSFKWKLFCRNANRSYQELPTDNTQLSGGRLKLSFSIPEDLIDFESFDIRLEAEPENGPGVFSLCDFRLYGIPMEVSLIQAHEYARVAKAIGAEDQYLPDFDRMDGWSAEKIEAEILSLRNKLQTRMAEESVSTVGALGISCPALEGLEAYPAAVVDENLILAFYNSRTIDLRVSVAEKVYLYKMSNDTLHLESTLTTDGNTLSLNKHAGTYIFLDRPVEEIRFNVVFDTEQISGAELSRMFFDTPPNNYLWMNIETFTQYQEKSSLDLPENWSTQNVFVYLLQDDQLEFIEEATMTNGTLRIKPAAGRYLLLDNPLEFFVEEADWHQKEIEDMDRIHSLEAQKTANFRRTLILIGCGVLAVIVGFIVYAIISRRKKR